MMISRSKCRPKKSSLTLFSLAQAHSWFAPVTTLSEPVRYLHQSPCMSLTASHRGVSRTSKPALTLRDSRQSIGADLFHLRILLRCALQQLCPVSNKLPYPHH